MARTDVAAPAASSGSTRARKALRMFVGLALFALVMVVLLMVELRIQKIKRRVPPATPSASAAAPLQTSRNWSDVG